MAEFWLSTGAIWRDMLPAEALVIRCDTKLLLVLLFLIIQRNIEFSPIEGPGLPASNFNFKE